ncbi:MAG: hypothetical protein R3E82_11695 [Pseudomonadales bacterium]
MNDDAVKVVSLKEIADTRLGYPFRGAIQDSAGGNVAVVTMKNADPDAGVDWAALPRTKLTGRKEPDWLRPGDVLFAARGSRNFAVHLDQVPDKAICAPQFYLLRVNAKTVQPSYLAWYLNQLPAQRYFAQSAEGTLVQSIRRAVLVGMPFPIPSVKRQTLIAKLSDAVRREKQLTEKLLHNREQQLMLVASELIE